MNSLIYVLNYTTEGIILHVVGHIMPKEKLMVEAGKEGRNMVH